MGSSPPGWATEMALRSSGRPRRFDLADSHVAIDGGVHIAALGGIWMTAVFGFAGLSLQSDGVAIDPQLPAIWRSLSFGLQWRGRRLKIRIDQAKQCRSGAGSRRANDACRERRSARAPLRPGPPGLRGKVPLSRRVAGQDGNRPSFDHMIYFEVR